MYQQYKTRTVLLQMKDDCKPFSWTKFFLWIKLNGPHISSFNRLHYCRFFFQSMLVVEKHRKLNLQGNWKIRTGKRRIQLILILCKHSAIFVQFENISVGFFSEGAEILTGCFHCFCLGILWPRELGVINHCMFYHLSNELESRNKE